MLAVSSYSGSSLPSALARLRFAVACEEGGESDGALGMSQVLLAVRQVSGVVPLLIDDQAHTAG